MNKKYITPESIVLHMDAEDEFLTTSSDYDVSIDESGLSVDDALTQKKYILDDDEWDD